MKLPRPINLSKNKAPIQCSLPHPHSSAWLDLSGDCRPGILNLFKLYTCLVYNKCISKDLVLHCKTLDGSQSLEIFVKSLDSQDRNLNWHSSLALESGSLQVVYGDIDANGSIDILYPVCSSSGPCSLKIVYNQQLPLCQGRSQSGCLSKTNLCNSQNVFTFSKEVKRFFFLDT